MTLLTEPTRIVLAKGQPVPNDPNFAFNSLLLHGNGTNGSTVITDSSGSPKTVTAFGNAQISTAQSKFGGASIAFDGAGDYLSAGILEDWTFLYDGTAFTVEAFVRGSTFSGNQAIASTIASSANRGILLSVNSGNLAFRIARGSSGNWALSLDADTVLSVDTWHHLAFVLTAEGLGAIYVNGTLDKSGTASSFSLLKPSYPLAIGATPNNSLFFNGYIDDLRITKGVARYTANFTPPTAPFPDF
jgi:hypothetical protein